MLGFSLPQFGGIVQGDLARFATTAENLGAGSLWVADRLLAPVDPSAGVDGTDSFPTQFRTAFDPFVALAVAAAVTTTATLGSSVLVAPWYPPVQLARQLASIDIASSGRLIAGLGIGWSPEEFLAAGATPARRGEQLDETLTVLHTMWSASPVQHDGPRWRVPPSWVDLKPAQPRLPVYLSAFTPVALERIGRRADGYLPVVRTRDDLAGLRSHRRLVDIAAEKAGRDPAAVSTQVRINVAAGTAIETVAELVSILADNGFGDAFVDLMYVADDVDAMLGWVEQLLNLLAVQPCPGA